MAQLSNIQWRYTAYKVRVGPFDAFVVMPPLLLFLMHIAWWTFFLAISVTVVMWIVELFFHMPLKVALRSLRSAMAGSRRPAVPWWRTNSL